MHLKPTPIGFPSDLKRQAEQAAEKQHTSLAAYVRQAVAEKLRRDALAAQRVGVA